MRNCEGPRTVSPPDMPASYKRVIHWFRRDLRVTDNTALNAACAAADEVVPVYIISDWTGSHRWTGPARQEFLCGCLESLAKNLEVLGGKLVFRRGKQVDELRRLAQETGAEAVFTNRDLDPFGQSVETELERACGEAGLDFRSSKDHVLHETGEVLTQDGATFRVYTPYARVWRNLDKAEPGGKPQSFRSPKDLRSLDRPDLETWELESSGVDFVEPGEKAARKRLEFALAEPLKRYARERNRPSGQTTSRLSQDLRFGLLSIREVYAKTREASRRATAAERESYGKFIGELAWREFYADILETWPEVLVEEFNPQWRGLEWDEADERFERWCRGETGFPIVDAGMRELAATGFLHNRVRMIVAMFLTKDLRIDWRHGERFFMQELVDGEIGSNNGGWQWSAGTGADAAPYFRVQNPWTQTKRFDPDGDYIRTWVPELADAPGKALSTEPSAGDSVWEGYVAPMVNHRAERQKTLDWFAAHKDA